ncbi:MULTISPECIES: glycosyltransferase family 2 protein [unclassified Bradyrhizobium]|uniref:glycosyltransferase family 2 protein n=1 Tax=unclassified Bradyrhizobium TaxID=2631580 RepID=UPI000411CB4F|nr:MULTISPECIES: glycosyltransferase family 2 protein [unclassified Bradyrhizobium]MCP3464998.1 glycosyltransferase family 2 protein [Bradyrhizobium sp. CCGUVB23]
MNTNAIGMANEASRAFVSIVAPCFNEEESVGQFVRRASLSAVTAVGANYEIILVDDGSSDETWKAIEELINKGDPIIGIRLSRNFGHQIALTAGLSAVRGTDIFVLDADLQDPPELLGEMLRVRYATGADVVYGKRRSRVGDSWFKKASARFFYRLLERMTDIVIPVDTGDFRLMSRRVTDLIAQMPERDRFIRGMVASVGFRQVPFEYDRQQRFAGETKYPLRKMLAFAADAFLGYSMTLLRFSSIAAICLLIVLFAVGLYSLYAWMYLTVERGWTSLMISIIVASFFQLVSLSIIGEYVGRIYLSGKARPLFIVDAVKRSAVLDVPAKDRAAAE